MKRLLIILVICFMGASASANNDKFYSLFIYNFTKYMEWSNHDGDFVIAVLGKSSVTEYLKMMSANKMVGTSIIVVKEVATVAEAKGANMIYLPASSDQLMSSVCAMAVSNNGMVVCESAGAATKGAAISFKEVQGKVTFEVNKTTLAKSGIKVNSKLEQLGIVVG